MGLEMVRRVWRYQGQCGALRPLGHQGYRLHSYKKDPPLHGGYTLIRFAATQRAPALLTMCCMGTALML